MSKQLMCLWGKGLKFKIIIASISVILLIATPLLISGAIFNNNTGLIGGAVTLAIGILIPILFLIGNTYYTKAKKSENNKPQVENESQDTLDTDSTSERLEMEIRSQTHKKDKAESEQTQAILGTLSSVTKHLLEKATQLLPNIKDELAELFESEADEESFRKKLPENKQCKNCFVKNTEINICTDIFLIFKSAKNAYTLFIDDDESFKNSLLELKTSINRFKSTILKLKTNKESYHSLFYSSPLPKDSPFYENIDHLLLTEANIEELITFLDTNCNVLNRIIQKQSQCYTNETYEETIKTELIKTKAEMAIFNVIENGVPM